LGTKTGVFFIDAHYLLFALFLSVTQQHPCCVFPYGGNCRFASINTPHFAVCFGFSVSFSAFNKFIPPFFQNTVDNLYTL